MKKILSLLMILGLCAGLTACGGDKSSEPKEKVFIEDSETGSMYSNPKNYEGKYVTITGRVFSNPEEDEGIIAFQLWADPENNDKNTIVGCEKNVCSDVKSDDYVKVTGYIAGEFEGENMMGGKVTAPQIKAESVEKISYADAVSPTTKSLDVNIKKSQNNVDMTVSKIEFAEKETRVYLTINNKGKSKFSFYSFNSKLTQDGKQYEEQSNYEADYPEINSEILPGIKSEGIVTFPAIKQSDFKLIFEGYSDDYNIDFDNYTFDIKVK